MRPPMPPALLLLLLPPALLPAVLLQVVLDALHGPGTMATALLSQLQRQALPYISEIEVGDKCDMCGMTLAVAVLLRWLLGLA